MIISNNSYEALSNCSFLRSALTASSHSLSIDASNDVDVKLLLKAHPVRPYHTPLGAQAHPPMVLLNIEHSLTSQGIERHSKWLGRTDIAYVVSWSTELRVFIICSWFCQD